MIDARRIRYLSFDCYGTLVDWEPAFSPACCRCLESDRGQVHIMGDGR